MEYAIGSSFVTAAGRLWHLFRLCYALFILASLAQCQILPPHQNQSLYICTAHSNEQLLELYDLSKHTSIDVWGHRHRIDIPIQIRVMDDTQDQSLMKIFNQSECILRTNDVHSMIAQSSSNAYERFESSDFFSAYQSYAAIGSKLLQWSEMYPSYVKLNSSIGKSLQDRDLYMIKITDFNVVTSKRAIWWNAGQHAREYVLLSLFGSLILVDGSDLPQSYISRKNFSIIRIKRC